jgi:glutaredoxin
MAEITVYGAPWCPDCKRSKKFLAEHRVPCQFADRTRVVEFALELKASQLLQDRRYLEKSRQIAPHAVNA